MYVKINEPQVSINLQKEKTPSKFIEFIKTWYVLIIVLILIIVTLGGTVTFASSQITSSGTSVNINNSNSNTSAYTPKPIYLESPVNGEFLLQENFEDLNQRKVLTVMIENLAGPDGARPQAGLQDADIVYETEAEGNITRFMGVFWNKKDTTKVMPIRSARKYFIDWTMEYNDPLYMHIGQAESELESTNALGALSKYSIKDLTGGKNSFDRDHTCEIKRAVEHCAFSDTAILWGIAKDRGWTQLGTLSTFLYKDDKAIDKEATTTKIATKVHVDFEEDPDNYSANWAYDKETNTYLRSIGKTPHIDQLSGKQLYAKTIIVQKTTIGVSEDHGKFHKIIKTLGSGEAWVIQDGKAVLATWRKDAQKNRTRYYDKTTGKELSLDRGKMWITVTGKSPIIS